MIDIQNWLDGFLQALDRTFGTRIWFAGLQGSYSRGEATETSDIDLVVILDELTAEDVGRYNAMLDTLPDRELVCGFLAGKTELFHWEPSDLFQFCHDTKPFLGSLEDVMGQIDGVALDRAIKIGACNIYHGCVHNMLYEKSEDILRGLYKAASFVLQAVCFKESGRYIRKQSELLCVLGDSDKAVGETFVNLRQGGLVEFGPMSETLLNWASAKITN